MLGCWAIMTWSTMFWATYFGSGFFLLSLNWAKVPRRGTTFLTLAPLVCLEPDLSKWMILPDFSDKKIRMMRVGGGEGTYMIDMAWPSALAPRSR